MTDRPDFRERPAPEPFGPAEADKLRQAVADLGEPDAAVRRMAARFLGRLGGEHALPHLVSAAADPDHSVREAALEALVSCGPRAREALSLALEDPQPAVRLAALRAVFRLEGAAAGQKIFSEQARSESALVRRRAILYLGLCGGREAEQDVLYGLRDPAPEVRRAAVFAAAALAGKRAASHLIAALDDADSGVRRQSVRALVGLFGDQAGRLNPQAELSPKAELIWKCWWQTRAARSPKGPEQI
jgi:HEAT repeat protein